MPVDLFGEDEVAPGAQVRQSVVGTEDARGLANTVVVAGTPTGPSTTKASLAAADSAVEVATDLNADMVKMDVPPEEVPVCHTAHTDLFTDPTEDAVAAGSFPHTAAGSTATSTLTFRPRSVDMDDAEPDTLTLTINAATTLISKLRTSSTPSVPRSSPKPDHALKARSSKLERLISARKNGLCWQNSRRSPVTASLPKCQASRQSDTGNVH
jgi:hypothetical protein